MCSLNQTVINITTATILLNTGMLYVEHYMQYIQVPVDTMKDVSHTSPSGDLTQ